MRALVLPAVVLALIVGGVFLRNSQKAFEIDGTVEFVAPINLAIDDLPVAMARFVIGGTATALPLDRLALAVQRVCQERRVDILNYAQRVRPQRYGHILISASWAEVESPDGTLVPGETMMSFMFDAFSCEPVAVDGMPGL